eukprot:TRINITY_DN4747_c0_g1_i12.p2 TRINITY_DN4747_c0_g1~~TRINITY_DN4747_c0_g1_i12.p2  ORF type:complete len:147 (-),score=5.35 TRINITY_DN4747_c0_g1_i12:722-1162(-)
MVKFSLVFYYQFTQVELGVTQVVFGEGELQCRQDDSRNDDSWVNRISENIRFFILWVASESWTTKSSLQIYIYECLYLHEGQWQCYLWQCQKNMILNEKLCFQEQRDDYDRVKKYRFKRATMFQEQRDDYHRSKGECMSVSWKIFS